MKTSFLGGWPETKSRMKPAAASGMGDRPGAGPQSQGKIGARMTPLYAAVDMHTLGDTFGRPYPPAPVIEGSIGIIKMLLAKGASPDAHLNGPILKRVYDAGDNRLGEGATPFMRAARKCDTTVMQLLLDAGADPKLTQKSGNNALMSIVGERSGGRSAPVTTNPS